jgi:diguanylate cyclase (GGDEF)-like protein
VPVALPPNLEAETERLLSLRTRDIKFSPEMASAYRNKTWPTRSKLVRDWMIWVGGLSCAYVPVSYLIIPDVIGYTALIGLLLLPSLITFGYLVWSKPRSLFIEGLSVFLILNVMMIAFGLLGFAAGGSDFERCVTAIFYVATAAIVILDIDYRWSLAVMISTSGIFCGFNFLNPSVALRTAIGTSAFYVVSSFAITLARKTQSLRAQRAFLMSLRDQYRSRQMEILASCDPLTGLANRRFAADHIESIWNNRRIAKSSIAFVMADIDSFKRLNDSAGHAAGDECLRRVARTIQTSVRLEEDLVSRYGGEEFLIVLTKVTPDFAWKLSERIRCAVEGLGIANPGLPKTESDRAGVVTVSIGIAFGRDDASPELVSKWADEALYEAKRSGRNRVFLSTAEAAADPSSGALTEQRDAPGLDPRDEPLNGRRLPA